MTPTELAKAMIRWEEMRRELDLLESQIEASVLALGKTQTVGNVRATFSAGRKIYDYEFAAHGLPREVYGPLSIKYRKTSYDWKAICQDAGISNIPYKQGESSVKVKLLEP